MCKFGREGEKEEEGERERGKNRKLSEGRGGGRKGWERKGRKNVMGGWSEGSKRDGGSAADEKSNFKSKGSGGVVGRGV